MPDMEVYHIFCISPLHTNSEWLVWMEGKSNKSSGCWRWISSQESCVDLELQQTGVPSVKPSRIWKYLQFLLDNLFKIR